jgi:hypothetical protein
MKNHFLLSLFLVIFSYEFSSSQLQMPVYPDYMQVAKEFFLKYSSGISDSKTRPNLAKKPDGWHMMVMDYSTNKVLKDELFWSLKKKKFLSLSFPLSNEEIEDPYKQQLMNNHWAQTASKLVPFWGYDGWDRDVIKKYGKKKSLSDSLLNGVARAYSSYARYLTRASEFGNPLLYEKIPKGANAMNPELLNTYLEHHQHASRFYYRLYQQNPKFETFVSDIYNVYSNDIMDAFLTLRYFQNEETARKLLKDKLFSPFYIEMAKNYLNSCDKDAILFTNGDMDTYPLLYVQETENYRKDVLVVNLSLLNLGRYIWNLANFGAGAKPITTSLDAEIYKSEKKQFFYIIENAPYPLSFKDIAEFISSSDPDTKYKTADNQFIDYIPSKEIFFNFEPGKTAMPVTYAGEDTVKRFVVYLKNNYLMLSDFCALDIIATNQFIRPVYFAITVDPQNFSLYSGFLSLEGLAYRLNPIQVQDDESNETGKIFPEVLQDKLLNQMKFNPTNYQNLFSSQKRMISLYRYLFSKLSSIYIELSSAESALMIMDYSLKHFPDHLIQFDYNVYPLISNYFRLNKEEKAIKIFTTCMSSCVYELERLTKLPPTDENKQQIDFQLASLNELTRILEIYQPENKILDEIREIINKYHSWE